MKHDYSLAHLTVLSLTPPQVVDVAARTGYRYVGLRMTRVTPDEVLYDLARDKALMRETKARLAEGGAWKASEPLPVKGKAEPVSTFMHEEPRP
jgi:hypothetical protein